MFRIWHHWLGRAEFGITGWGRVVLVVPRGAGFSCTRRHQFIDSFGCLEAQSPGNRQELLCVLSRPVPGAEARLSPLFLPAGPLLRRRPAQAFSVFPPSIVSLEPLTGRGISRKGQQLGLPVFERGQGRSFPELLRTRSCPSSGAWARLCAGAAPLSSRAREVVPRAAPGPVRPPGSVPRLCWRCPLPGRAGQRLCPQTLAQLLSHGTGRGSRAFLILPPQALLYPPLPPGVFSAFLGVTRLLSLGVNRP